MHCRGTQLCILTNAPALAVQAAKDRAAQPEAGNAGTIKAAWPGRRSERSLAGSSLYSSSHTDAMSIREAAAAQRGSAPAAGGLAGHALKQCLPSAHAIQLQILG